MTASSSSEYQPLASSSNGFRNNVRRISKLRANLKGWWLPLLLVPAARIIASRRALWPLAVVLGRCSARLVVRDKDFVVKAPILDAWPVFEVFAFGEYDLALAGGPAIQDVICCCVHVGSFSMWIVAWTGARVLAA